MEIQKLSVARVEFKSYVRHFKQNDSRTPWQFEGNFFFFLDIDFHMMSL